jgi:hypothetical protein
MMVSSLANETQPYVSATFQDILRRVSSREPESKAILYVNAKLDAPHKGNFRFHIEEIKGENGNVSITLSQSSKVETRVYESYRLKADAAILQELANQKRWVEIEIERRKQFRIQGA